MKFDTKLVASFIIAAYCTYLFHEFGHWLCGELLGYDMYYSLNFVWPSELCYESDNHALLVSLCGPAFNIFQALLFTIIVSIKPGMWTFPFVLFPFYNRCFAILLGGLSRQDEGYSAQLLDTAKYGVAIIVIGTLAVLTWHAARRLELNLRQFMYSITIVTACQLLVIWSYKFLGSL